MSYFKIFTFLLSITFLFTQCQAEKDDLPDNLPNYNDSLKVGLWAYFPLDNNFNDTSGNNRHMRGVNNIQFSADKMGTAAKALLFDGINDHSIIDAGNTFPEGDFSISFNLYPEKTIGGRIFNKANLNDGRGASVVFGFADDFANNKFSYGIRSEDAVCNTFSDLSNTASLNPNLVIMQNAWYNIVVSFENGVQKVYVNGKIIAAQRTSYTAIKNCTNAPIYFGIWWLQDLRPFKGKMDNIMLHTRAITENEIKYLHAKN